MAAVLQAILAPLLRYLAEALVSAFKPTDTVRDAEPDLRSLRGDVPRSDLVRRGAGLLKDRES